MTDEAELSAWCLTLVQLIRGGVGTEEEGDRFYTELCRLKPNPNWSDLMFYNVPNLSDEEVVEAGLAYRPMAL